MFVDLIPLSDTRFYGVKCVYKSNITITVVRGELPHPVILAVVITVIAVVVVVVVVVILVSFCFL